MSQFQIKVNNHINDLKLEMSIRLGSKPNKDKIIDNAINIYKQCATYLETTKTEYLNTPTRKGLHCSSSACLFLCSDIYSLCKQYNCDADGQLLISSSMHLFKQYALQHLSLTTDENGNSKIWKLSNEQIIRHFDPLPSCKILKAY